LELGNQHPTIRIIRCHAAVLEVRIEDHFAEHAAAPLGYLGESGVLHKFIRVYVILSY
jgi:hypothetical protein